MYVRGVYPVVVGDDSDEDVNSDAEQEVFYVLHVACLFWCLVSQHYRLRSWLGLALLGHFALGFCWIMVAVSYLLHHCHICLLFLPHLLRAEKKQSIARSTKRSYLHLFERDE